MNRKKAKKDNIAVVALLWFLGVMFALLGLIMMTLSLFSGIVLFVASAFLIPPAYSAISKQTKTKFPAWSRAVIVLVCFSLSFYFFPSENLQTPEDRIAAAQQVLDEYHKTHTYTMIDFFVCADMASDVWNMVKTRGINAKIVAGSIEYRMSDFETELEYFMNIDHAWVLAEVSPFEWIALETTGGYLVYAEDPEYGGGSVAMNDLYYTGYFFDSPGEFKKFITLRDRLFEVCNEANMLMDEFELHYGESTSDPEGIKLIGQAELKSQECNNIYNQISGLVT